MNVKFNWWLFKKWWFWIIFITGVSTLFAKDVGSEGVLIIIALNSIWVLLFLFLRKKQVSDDTDSTNNEPLTNESEIKEVPQDIYPEVPYGFHRSYYYENVLIDNNVNFDIVKLAEYLDIDDNYSALGLFHNGQLAGDFPQNKLTDMVYDYRKKGGKVLARISKVNEDSFEIALGYYLENGFEYKQLKNKKNAGYKTFTLSGNSSNAMQEVVECLDEGDELELEFDFDKDKYAVYSYDCAGYLPKSANNYIDEDKEYTVYVNEVFDKDNGKCGAKVDVFEI